MPHDANLSERQTRRQARFARRQRWQGPAPADRGGASSTCGETSREDQVPRGIAEQPDGSWSFASSASCMASARVRALPRAASAAVQHPRGSRCFFALALQPLVASGCALAPDATRLGDTRPPRRGRRQLSMKNVTRRFPIEPYSLEARGRSGSARALGSAMGRGGLVGIRRNRGVARW